MSKENTDRRPPFINYVRVRHTGLSPYKLNPNTFPVRARREPLSTRNPQNAITSRPQFTTRANPPREVVRRKPTATAMRRHAILPENSGRVVNEENEPNNIISSTEDHIQTLENVQSVIIEQNGLESNENEPSVDEITPVNTEIAQNLSMEEITPVNTDIEQNPVEEITPVNTEIAQNLSMEEITPLNADIEQNPVEEITPLNTVIAHNETQLEEPPFDSDSEGEFIENDFATELSNEDAPPEIFLQTSSPCLDEITFSFMGLHVGEEEVIIEVTPNIGSNINEEKEFSSYEPSCSNTQNQEKSEVLIQDNTFTDLENNKENIQPLVIVESKQEGEVESIYRLKLETETARLSKLADSMDSLKKDTIPINILDEIYSIVGLTRLLIRSKFKQFSNLIDTYSSNKLKPEDLEGFWEMMYLQVDQLNNKYAKLDQLKETGWVAKEENQKPKKKIRRGGAKRNKKYKNIQSRIKLNKENSNVDLVPSTPKTPSKVRHDAAEETFRNDALSKTPKLLVNKNILNAQNSRRSSLDIIVRKSLLGKLL